MNAEILETEEVKSLMYHQWKNPQEVHVDTKPDFKQIFGKIKKKIHYAERIDSPNVQFLIKEVEELKSNNQAIKRRLRNVLALAASIIIVLASAGIFIIQTNHVFRTTYTENIVPNGQRSQVLLPDGTKVYLNSGTVLRYDNSFGKKYRHCELSGEAYFEVKKNKKIPFVIQTADVEVKVVGTKFNVMAYPDDDFVETIVSEGKVSVTERYGNSKLMLAANQKGTYHKSTQLLLLNEVNPDQYISWTENVLSFDNENFSEVIKRLERWYDVNIDVEGTDSIRDRFTLTIKNESIKEVLELISLTTDITYTVDADQVTVVYH
jgi:ferric-dicitrate binding protein FerR (iron transport regulator)